jgi:methyl-accepting chemotaxis protein
MFYFKENKVKFIFIPAINFMNKLSYAYKFGLISVLFLAQILTLSYVWVDSENEKINKSEREISSVSDVKSMMDVIKISESYRDLSTVSGFYGGNGLKEEADSIRKKLSSELLALIAKFEGKNISKELELYRNGWLSKTLNNGATQPTFIDQYRFYNEFTNELIVIAREWASDSGLTHDEDINVQQMMKLVVADYPSIRASAGLARVAGMFAYQEKYLASHTFDQLNGVFDQLVDSEKKQKNIHEYFNKKLPAISAEMNEELLLSINKFTTIKNRLDNNIIAATDLSGNWRDYYFETSADIDAFHMLPDRLLSKIHNLIEIRLETQKTQLFILITVLVSILLIIFYLYTAFYISIHTTVDQFRAATHLIAKGEMNTRISLDTKDEMGQLVTEFNYMVNQIHELILAVKETARDVGVQSKQVEDSASQSSQAASCQLKATNEVVKAVSMMKESADVVSSSSADAASAAASASDETSSATIMVDEALTSIKCLADEINISSQVIDQLAQSSSSITNLLGVIKSIAEQTNLLALNAAIEAARAGEQGRGFAVVDDEVRTLASRTQASAQEIEEVMTGLQGGVDKAVLTMNSSHEMAQSTVQESNKIQIALERINESVAAIVERNTYISSAALAQAKVTKTIDENVASINAQGENTADGAEGTLKSIEEMGRLTASLYARMDKFNVKKNTL